MGTFLLGAAVGFLLGWLLLKRPEVVTEFIEWLKGKFNAKT